MVVVVLATSRFVKARRYRVEAVPGRDLRLEARSREQSARACRLGGRLGGRPSSVAWARIGCLLFRAQEGLVCLCTWVEMEVTGCRRDGGI